jgi:hypothetical protein
MTSALVADSVVSICGALGLFVAIVSLHRRDPKGALTRRAVFALGLVATLFLVRGLDWWADSDVLERVALCLAAILPLAVLVMTEGFLRRHAPTILKIIVLAASGVLAMAALFGAHRLWPPASWLLATFQLAAFATAAVMIYRRDRASLTAVENFSVSRLAIAALLVIPFLLSDYRTLFPFVPIKLGALGSLLVVTMLLFESEGEETRRRAFPILSVRILSAMALGAAAAAIEPNVAAVDVFRFMAVTVSGVLAIALLVDLLQSLRASRSPGLLATMAFSKAEGREALLAEIARHPIFESSRRLKAEALAEFDPPILSAALQDCSVLRRSDHPWRWAPSSPQAERLSALMASYAATHLIVMQSDPLDLLLIAVPVVSADPATETALLLMRRILSASPQAMGNQR